MFASVNIIMLMTEPTLEAIRNETLRRLDGEEKGQEILTTIQNEVYIQLCTKMPQDQNISLEPIEAMVKEYAGYIADQCMFPPDNHDESIVITEALAKKREGIAGYLGQQSISDSTCEAFIENIRQTVENLVYQRADELSR